MIVGELTFYALIGTLATVATVITAVGVRKFSGRKRRIALVAPYTTAMLALGYFGMANEVLRLHSASGRPVPLSRFVVYFFSYTVIIAYVGMMADAERRHILVGVGLLSTFSLGALINWMTAPPVESVGKLLFLGSLLGILWLLFRPYTRAAQAVSGPRRLAFGKLRNLMALLLIMYLVVGLTSRQGMGLLGTFTGVYMGAYMDVFGQLGFAGILLRSDTAIEHLANERSSLLAVLRDDGPRPSEPDASTSD
ncbi:bacteriorhodopsin [Halorientalis brevis]|uniref:Bacteriorhodopsin n=1 Tax=Halorientalis brevis TaxID=1126241 RepID=A0ABD6C724_9EURY|nr:bacteriorhodopsin [Halorientalis brevis]